MSLVEPILGIPSPFFYSFLLFPESARDCKIVPNNVSIFLLQKIEKGWRLAFGGASGTPEHQTPKEKKIQDLISRGFENTGTPNTKRETNLRSDF